MTSSPKRAWLLTEVYADREAYEIAMMTVTQDRSYSVRVRRSVIFTDNGANIYLQRLFTSNNLGYLVDIRIYRFPEPQSNLP